MKVKFYNRKMEFIAIKDCESVSYTRQKNKEYSISFTPIVNDRYDFSDVYFFSLLDDNSDKDKRLTFLPCGVLTDVDINNKCSGNSIEHYLQNISVLPENWGWWNNKTLKSVLQNHIYGFRTYRKASFTELSDAVYSHHVEVATLENGNGEVYAGTADYRNVPTSELYYYSDGYIIYRMQVPEEARRAGMVLRWADVTGGNTDIGVQFRWSETGNDYTGEYSAEQSPVRGEDIKPNETAGVDIPESSMGYLFIRFNLKYNTGTISETHLRGINYDNEVTSVEEGSSTILYYGTTAILNAFEVVYRVETHFSLGDFVLSDTKLNQADISECTNLLESLKAISEAYNISFFCTLSGGTIALNCYDAYVNDTTNDFVVSDVINASVQEKDTAIDVLQAVEAFGAGTGLDRVHTFVKLNDEEEDITNIGTFEDSDIYNESDLITAAKEYIATQNEGLSSATFEYYNNPISMYDKVKAVIKGRVYNSTITEEKISIDGESTKKSYTIGIKEYPFRTLYSNPFGGTYLAKPPVPSNFTTKRTYDGWAINWKGSTNRYIMLYRVSGETIWNSFVADNSSVIISNIEYNKTYEFKVYAVSVNNVLSDATEIQYANSGDETGFQTASIILYKRASSEPTKPSNSLVYTFVDSVLTGDMDGWSDEFVANDGNPLYVTKYTAVSKESSVTIASADWSAPVLLVDNGSDGEAGYRTTSIELFQWASSAPTSFPSGSSEFNWVDGTFTLPVTLNGWSLTGGTASEGQSLYRVRQVYTDNGTSLTSTITWSAISSISVGTAGENGTRRAVLELYKWSADTPTAFPSGTSTYTWETGSFTMPSTLNGWAVNAGNGNEGESLYYCFMVYTDKDTSETSSVSWSTNTAYKTGYNGSDGSDATAQVITSPTSTTPNATMVYPNIYYGIYAGAWYKWAWTNTTTGFWTYTDVTPITDSWANYTGLEIPELPDNIAGTTQKITNFTTMPSGWMINRTPVITYNNGLMNIASDGNNNKGVFTYGKSQCFICKFRVNSGSLRVGYESVSGQLKIYTASPNWQYASFYAPSASTIILYQAVAGNSDISAVYIGTGAYDTLVFDNSYHHRHLINNAVIPTPQGFYFNGSTSYLRSRDTVTLPDVFTFRATVNCAVSATQIQTLFACGTVTNQTKPYVICFRRTGTNHIIVYASSGSANIEVFTGTNYFTGLDNTDIKTEVTIDFINKTIKVYRNNVQFLTTASAPTMVKPVSNYFYLGDFESAGVDVLLGYMKDVSLHDHALTDAQRNWLAQGNKLPTPYTLVDYVQEQYDDDGVISANEKPAILSSWLSIYALNPASSALTTTSTVKDGDYSTLVAEALSAGLTASTGQVVDYIAKSNAIRDYCFNSTTGVLLNMNISSAVAAGSWDALKSQYNTAKEALRTGITNQRITASSGLNPLSSNDYHQLPTDSDGTILSYEGSQNIIQVFEGVTELQATTGIPTAGQYAVAATPTYITAGTKSVSGKTMAFGVASAMSAVQNSAYITYTITGLTTNNTAFTVYLTQSFSKAQAGSDGSRFYILPSVSQVLKDKNGTLTPSTVSATRYAQIASSSPAVSTIGTLKYMLSTESTETTTSNGAAISIGSALWIEFYFYDASEVLLERQRVWVLTDGADGSNAIVMTSASAPAGTYTGQLGEYSSLMYRWSGTEWVRITAINWGLLSTDPSSGMIKDDTYTNSVTTITYKYDGTDWIAITQAVASVTPKYLGALTSLPLSYTIGDFFVVQTTFSTYDIGKIYYWSGSAWVLDENYQSERYSKAMIDLLAIAAGTGDRILCSNLVANSAFIGALKTISVIFGDYVASASSENPEVGDKIISMGKAPVTGIENPDEFAFLIAEKLGENNWMKHLWSKKETLGALAGLISLVMSGCVQANGGLFSKAGEVWAQQVSPFGTSYVYGIAYGNGKWVAGGGGGKIAYSTDGITFTLGTSPFGTSNVYGIAYGNGKWVAVGSNGKIAYSTNGITFTLGTSPFGTNVVIGIAYGNGKWVAADSDGKIAYSTDGITFTLGTSPFGTSNVQGIAYGNGKWVAVGSNGKIAYSTNGITFTLGTSPFGTSYVYGIAYGNGKWVAASFDGKIAYSTDGITFTLGTSPFGTSSVYGVAYGNGKWVAVGESGKIAYSTDGITFKAENLSQPFGGDGYFNAVATDNEGNFIVVGYRYSTGAGIIAKSSYLEAGAGIISQQLTTGRGVFKFSGGFAMQLITIMTEQTAAVQYFALPEAFDDTNYFVFAGQNFLGEYSYQTWAHTTTHFKVRHTYSNGLQFNILAIGKIS